MITFVLTSTTTTSPSMFTFVLVIVDFRDRIFTLNGIDLTGLLVSGRSGNGRTGNLSLLSTAPINFITSLRKGPCSPSSAACNDSRVPKICSRGLPLPNRADRNLAIFLPLPAPMHSDPLSIPQNMQGCSITSHRWPDMASSITSLNGTSLSNRLPSSFKMSTDFLSEAGRLLRQIVLMTTLWRS